MAETVETFCEGKAQKAEQALGWNRKTIKKAREERGGQFCYVDQRHLSGRKKAEDHLPNLLNDLNEIAEQFSQTDPTFRTTRLFISSSVASTAAKVVGMSRRKISRVPCSWTREIFSRSRT